MPLAALHDGEKFLIEKYSLGTMPSVSSTDTSYQTLKEAQVLAMGTKDFPRADLKPLNAVPLELATIIGKIWSGKYFLDNEFTLENLRSQRSQNRFDIVHLATHAEFIPNNSNNARIYFRNQGNSRRCQLRGTTGYEMV